MTAPRVQLASPLPALRCEMRTHPLAPPPGLPISSGWGDRRTLPDPQTHGWSAEAPSSDPLSGKECHHQGLLQPGAPSPPSDFSGEGCLPGRGGSVPAFQKNPCSQPEGRENKPPLLHVGAILTRRRPLKTFFPDPMRCLLFLLKAGDAKWSSCPRLTLERGIVASRGRGEPGSRLPSLYTRFS